MRLAGATMNSLVLKMTVLPAIAVLLKFVYPFLQGILPLDKEVFRVTSLQQKLDDPARQYPILNFIGLVERHGYTAEEYNITTDDGYKLLLHRISGSPHSPKASGKPIVYLQHGIGLSSDSWVLIGPQKDLAFLLADSGRDVWLGNVRGNAYGRSHISKNPKNPDFWSFSYHEMAIFDIRAIIDRILKETEMPKLTYYGYSMGTTISYVLLSTYPEYNEKVELLYSIAPVVFWNHDLKRLMKIVDTIYDLLQQFIEYFNLFSLLPQSAVTAFIGCKFCGDDNVITQPLCLHTFSNIGLDPKRFNKTKLPEILAHFPAGISALTVSHYNQNFKRKTFQAYDYGKIENNRRYGQSIPPEYNLSNVRVPTHIWYAKSDDIVNEEDVFDLTRVLPNVASLRAVHHPKFNHFDFLWANDVRELLYEQL